MDLLNIFVIFVILLVIILFLLGIASFVIRRTRLVTIFLFTLFLSSVFYYLSAHLYATKYIEYMSIGASIDSLLFTISSPFGLLHNTFVSLVVEISKNLVNEPSVITNFFSLTNYYVMIYLGILFLLSAVIFRKRRKKIRKTFESQYDD